MSSRKTADLAVKVGSYQNAQGENKNRYKNCGMILTKDDGVEMLMIDPLFNFAAVQRDQGRDYVILSKFDVKEDANAGTSAQAAKTPSTPQFEE